MKNSLRRHDSILVLAATLACAVMASACVMDASPTPEPTSGSSTTEMRSVAQPAANVVTAPAPNAKVAPKLESAFDPAATNGPVAVPPSPALPRAENGTGVDDPNIIVEDGPRPHPWEPDPNDPNGKPKIGGAEQTGGGSSPPYTSGK